MKEILLVGFGAVGAIYALVLSRSERVRVTIVARSNFEIIQVEGVHYRSLRYGNITAWRPDRACASVEEAADQAYSHVLVTTKTVPEVQTTPELLAPLLSASYIERFPLPIFVLLQNGINIHSDLFRTLKSLRPHEEPKVLTGSLWIGVRLVEANVVEHSDFDRIQLGICRSTPNVLTNSPEEIALLDEFANLMRAGGTDVDVVAEIQRAKFEKNIINCVISPAISLSRFPMQAIFRPPEVTPKCPDIPPSAPKATIGSISILASYPAVAENTIPFLYEAFKEVVSVGDALFPPTEEDLAFGEKTAVRMLETLATITSKPTSTEKPSMYIDVEKSRPTELEVIVGEVVRAGRQLGVSIPRLETLYALMTIVQQQLLH